MSTLGNETVISNRPRGRDGGDDVVSRVTCNHNRELPLPGYCTRNAAMAAARACSASFSFSPLNSPRSVAQRNTVKADDSAPPQPPQYRHARTPTRKKTESLSALAIAISNWLYYPKGKKSVERWNLVVSSLAFASVQRTRRTNTRR